MSNRVCPSRTHTMDTPSPTSTNSYLATTIPVCRPYHNCFRQSCTLSSSFQSTVVNITLMSSNINKSNYICQATVVPSRTTSVPSSVMQPVDGSRDSNAIHGELSSCVTHTLYTCNLTSNAASCCVRFKIKSKIFNLLFITN